MNAALWAAWHLARGHLVLPGRSPAIPAVPVWRCRSCSLVRQAI